MTLKDKLEQLKTEFTTLKNKITTKLQQKEQELVKVKEENLFILLN